MVNFAKEGKVGDAVKHHILGDGKIMSIRTGKIRPIGVVFADGNWWFFANGAEVEYGPPTLCFANGKYIIDQGSPPEREPPAKRHPLACGDAMNVLQEIRDVLDTGEDFVDCNLLGDVKVKTIITPYGKLTVVVYNRELAKKAESYGLRLVGANHETGTYRFILSDGLTTKPKYKEELV